MERDRDVPRQQLSHARRAQRARDEQSGAMHTEHVHTVEQTFGVESANKRGRANSTLARLAILSLRQESTSAHQTLLAQDRSDHSMLGQTYRQAQMYVHIFLFYLLEELNILIRFVQSPTRRFQSN